MSDDPVDTLIRAAERGLQWVDYVHQIGPEMGSARMGVDDNGVFTVVQPFVSVGEDAQALRDAIRQMRLAR